MAGEGEGGFQTRRYKMTKRLQVYFQGNDRAW